MKEATMKRAAIYLFYDERGIVDDYVLVKLKHLRAHVENIFVISNSVLADGEKSKLEEVADTVRERKNVGFDVWGYKEALEAIGWNSLVEYDEVILLNYTFFGPIFPFSEMFGRMERTSCDFWGISAHKEITPNPYTQTGSLPLHIQSHFIAIRRRMLSSPEFQAYWRDMPMIESYSDSILRHETRFTEYFFKKGFNFEVLLDPEDYDTDYALFTSLQQTLENRSPILKKRPFVHDPIYLEQNVISLRNAMDLIESRSDYDTDLIWKSVLRSAEPRALYTNMDLLEVLPDQHVSAEIREAPRLAVVAHMYYADMMPEVMSYLANIPFPFDLYITTDSSEKAELIRADLGEAHPRAEIRVLHLNQGRDMAPLVIGANDVIRPGKYDLICRLHSKKSPQDPPNVGENFKNHMFGNMLRSREYVANIIGLFQNNPNLGMVMPPVIHSGYPTLGHSWSINRELSKAWAKKLGIHVPFDADTPLAPYGGMFWFRPDALSPITEYPWTIQDFEAEVGKVDGTLPHVLERLMAYACHEAGFHVRCILHPRAAAVGYTKLEYKLQRLAALMPSGLARDQLDWLHLVRAHLAAEGSRNSFRFHLEACIRIARQRFITSFPRLALALKKPYGVARKAYHGIMSKAK